MNDSNWPNGNGHDIPRERHGVLKEAVMTLTLLYPWQSQ